MIPAASAQPRYREHPHYLHALSDLRYARFLLNRTEEWNVWVDQKEATNRIDRAIAEIKRASIDDHKNLNDHPAPDPTWDHVGRIHKAIELLESAERDLRFEEDDYRALGWRDAAIEHVHEARQRAVKALIDKRRDERRY
jgi:tetratricopeptide (TPR) repeat protein